MAGSATSRALLWGIMAATAAIAVWTRTLDAGRWDEVFRAFAVSGEAFREGRYWTLFTYGFFHGGLAHVALNLIALKITGDAVIGRWGWPSFLALFAAGVVAGGLVQAALRPDTYLVGFSGGVFALLVAACLGRGDDEVALRLGPLRLARLRGCSLGYGFLIGALLMALATLGREDAAIAHDCHAAGALAGWIWWRAFWRTR